MNKRLEVLNSLEVVDYSASCGELEYVLSENNEVNIQKLKEAGFTDEEIQDAYDNDNRYIDTSLLAMGFAGACCWSKDDGFSIEEWEAEA